LQRKSKKREKQRFRSNGRAENEKNSVSVAAEEQKTRKTVFPLRRKSKKTPAALSSPHRKETKQRAHVILIDLLPKL